MKIQRIKLMTPDIKIRDLSTEYGISRSDWRKLVKKYSN